MKIIFISDLHLAPHTIDKNLLFFSFLQHWIQRIDALYILGDFFDFWVGDDDDNPFTQQIKLELNKFSQHTPIYFIGGNHDFAVGKAFAKQSGIQLLRDLATLEINGKRLLLSHGDIFCTLDLSYQRMKKILQNPLTIFLLRRLPLKLRYKIKETLSSKAKNHNQTHRQAEYTYQVVADSVIAAALKANASIVIHGHTHRPGYYPLNSRDGSIIERYEIPDWEERLAGGYLLWEQGHITLEHYQNTKD